MLIESKQPVIARLEGADYEWHSLTIPRRIAGALQQPLEVRFVTQQPSTRWREASCGLRLVIPGAISPLCAPVLLSMDSRSIIKTWPAWETPDSH